MSGFSGPHAQTMLGYFMRPRRRPAHLPLRRERWSTSDGDFFDVDILPASPSAPRVLLLHGLEGSSRSGYIINLLGALHALEWGALALNFRSCSGVPNLLPLSYNSGDTTDTGLVLNRLSEQGSGPLFAAGFSLGANVLLRLLGQGRHLERLAAAVAVSPPNLDLSRCADTLDVGRGWVRLYRNLFLRSLKKKALRKAERFPEQLDAARIRACRSLRAFDEEVTAPLHGYRGAADYYAQASSGPLLARIETPTLVLTAEDDPLTTDPQAQPPPRSPWLNWVTTAHGGHVGFLGGTLVAPEFWMEEQLLAFFAYAAAAIRPTREAAGIAAF